MAPAIRSALLGLMLCFASGVVDAEQVRLKAYNVPSSSMAPTLKVGDVFFIAASPTIARGDIIVFNPPPQPSIDYVKRVIGLPGDRVRVTHGVVSVNGVALIQTPAGPCEITQENGAAEHAECFDERLLDGRMHVIAKLDDASAMNNTDDYVVPPGDLFVMGDNRDNSLDSRYLEQVGYIPLKNVHGVARVIYFSRDFSRIFKSIR